MHKSKNLTVNLNDRHAGNAKVYATLKEANIAFDIVFKKYDKALAGLAKR